jgi:hypothetical protein
MLRLCLIILAMIACSHRASAEPVTLRCLDATEMAYFLTFDVGTRKAVFKSAGGNLIEGTVTASEPGRIAFTLSRGDPPDFDLVWDEASATLTWIAIPNIAERSRGFKGPCTRISPPDK